MKLWALKYDGNVNFNILECSDYMFHCDGYKCIPQHMSCDGYSNCADGMDEDTSHCGKTFTDTDT